MKCKYTFPADSILRLAERLTFSKNSREYAFEVSNGFIVGFSVTIENYPLDLLPRRSMNAQWEFPKNILFSELLDEIRTLEGTLAIRGIRKIETRYYTLSLIPETPSEAATHPPCSIVRSRTDPKLHQARDANPSDLVRNVLSTKDVCHLQIPLQFNRRGRDAMRDDRFIEAIYNFYFFIESLFGNGKFKTTAILAELSQSIDLSDAVKFALKTPHPEVAEDSQLLKEYNAEYAAKSAPEVIRLLVELRGFLHHHTLKRTDIWNPADQADFRTDAYFWSTVCQEVAMNQIHRHSFANDKTNELRQTRAWLGNRLLKWT